jgi:7-keto-8-aminopelargonate synthetase-like enzyme
MFHQLDSVHGRTCRLNNKDYLFFSGYDYLGMQAQTEFKSSVKEGLDKYGWLHASSRISNTQLKLYHELENALSALTGHEDTVTFSSGYMAGQAVSKLLAGYKTVFKAPGTHPALSVTDTQSLQTTFEDWSTEVTAHIHNKISHEPVAVFFDSINIFKPSINDISFLDNIDPKQKLLVIIDDSHGIGLIGENGKGISHFISQKKNINYIIIYSLSKAFNINGGAVSCSKKLADTLRETTAYSASTALSPAMAFAFLQSKKLYSLQLQFLKKSISYFLKHINQNVLSNADLPIAVLKEPGIENKLFKKNIIISSFNYPLASSPKTNRIVLNAAHTKKDITELISALL